MNYYLRFISWLHAFSVLDAFFSKKKLLFFTKKEYGLRIYVKSSRMLGRRHKKRVLHDLINRGVIDDYH
jgi:hypothetical protein